MLEDINIIFSEIGHLPDGVQINNSYVPVKQLERIDLSEWNNFRGFWESCQSNGPHHGLSNNEEAIYRLHTATALSRYLLFKFSYEDI